MKKNQTIVRIMAAIVIVFGVELTASAQLGGLKGLANKAKKAAKEKADDTKNHAVGQVSETAGIPTDNGIDASNVVWRWTGKESELGEWADKIVFNGDRKSEAYKSQTAIHMKIFHEILPLLGSTTSYGLTNYITYGPDKKKAFPWDEIPRYAWTKAFVDNPTLDNFKVFAMTLLYDTPTYMVYLEYIMNDKANGVVNSQKGWTLPWPSESEMRSERTAREDYAIEIAKKKIALKDICEYACQQYKTGEAALETSNASYAHGYFLGEALRTRVIETHPDYNESADYVREVKVLASKWDANNRAMYVNMIEACGIANAKPVDVPTGVSVATDIKTNGDAAAKKWCGVKNLEYVKTIYFENKWRAFKNPKYPYNVTHHSVSAAVIAKQGQKYVMQKMDLQKSLKGEYGMVPALGAKLQPVNYK